MSERVFKSIAEVDLALISALPKAQGKEDLLAELAEVLLAATRADSVDILLRESGDVLLLKASTSHPEMIGHLRLGRNVGLCGRCLTDAEPAFILEHAKEHPNYARYGDTDRDACEAVIVVPLAPSGEMPEGVIQLCKDTSWPLDHKEQGELLHLAEVIGNVVAGFKTAYNSATNTNKLGALSEVTKNISTSYYLEEILQLLVNMTAQQFNYTVCTVRLLDENRKELVLRATQAPAKAYQRKAAIKLGESIAGRAISENRPIIVRDVLVEEDYIGHDLAVEQGLRSMICVPLMLQDKPIGVLSCYTSDVREFLSDEIRALETLAKQASLSIEHAKLSVRNTLMQEMHHRVKNNLQQVASLLRLQMRHSTYKSIEEALSDCHSRIMAIASVHELLARDDLDHVGIRSIAESLVHIQQSSLILPNRSVLFLVRGDDVKLSMTQATQLALVLNELIQNAVEHGFEETTKGEIHVTVEDHDEEVAIWVSNSGDPLPEGFDLSRANSLGLQIVDSLARALGGRFLLTTIMGWTVAEVKFPRATGE